MMLGARQYERRRTICVRESFFSFFEVLHFVDDFFDDPLQLSHLRLKS